MEIYELITKGNPPGFSTGIDNEGVNFLDPPQAFEDLQNGYVYRQELRSRKGFVSFGDQLSDGSRVMGIFQNVNPQTSAVTTLACSKDYLYQYNSATNVWDQIPFNARLLALDPAYVFNISADNDYVSGTTYPDKDNNQRFVFCSRGMSEIYFYDGTEIGVFTNTDDNDQYENPTTGTLSRATYVTWFGERLNFFKPVITSVEYPQQILFSGIRTASGNGDKFNVAGSGQVDADTFEIMTGMTNFSNYLVLNFQRSTWVIRKTRDPFNPYFLEKVPSVLGTDASFSAVAWNNEVKSVGKTGFITTDGRQSLRFDTKIPYFAANKIDAQNFDLTYGGFDRINAQFFFSYRQSGSTLSDVTQDKVIVYNYEESQWSVNDARFSVFGQSISGEELTWDDIVYSTEHPTWGRMDTTEEIWNQIGVTSETQKTLAGDNDGFIYHINEGYDDYFATVSAITQASSAVATISGANFKVGDRVIFLNVEGMTEINNQILTVTAATTTSITVSINSTLFTAYTGAGTVEKVIDFYAKLTPFNPYREVGRRCYINCIEVLLDTNSNDVYLDIFEDEEEAPYKTVLLSPNASTTKAREWITATVDNEANFHNFVLRNQSYENPTVVSSIRVHAQEGGYTSS